MNQLTTVLTMSSRVITELTDKPHDNANSANAKDIVENLLDQSMNLVLATWSCFEDQDGQVVNKFNDALIANLLLDIKEKLELIEKALPLAFEDSQSKKAVTL